MINFNSTATFEEKDYMERCVKSTYAVMSFFEIEEIISLRNEFVNMQAAYLSTIDSISQMIQLSVDALSVVQTEHTMNLFSEKAKRAIKTGIDANLVAKIQSTIRKSMDKINEAQNNINDDYRLGVDAIYDEKSFSENGVNFNTSVHTNPDSAKFVFGGYLSEKLGGSITSYIEDSSKSDSTESARYALYERQLYEIFKYSDMIANLSSDVSKLDELYDSYQMAYLTITFSGLNKRKLIDEFVDRPFLDVYRDIIMVGRAHY